VLLLSRDCQIPSQAPDMAIRREQAGTSGTQWPNNTLQGHYPRVLQAENGPKTTEVATTLTMSHFRQRYNELGKERIFPSLAVIEANLATNSVETSPHLSRLCASALVIEANFATNSVETVCPDSFFPKRWSPFAVVLRLM